MQIASIEWYMASSSTNTDIVDAEDRPDWRNDHILSRRLITLAMTDTETKLQDAVTQFDLAANTESEPMVRSCINAMIDMGRSVTLVMQKESGPYPALTKWYENRMAELMRSAEAPLMKFFNERRVHTVHKGVIRPQRDTAIVTGSSVPGVAAGATMILWRFEGAVEFLGASDSGGMHRLSMRYLDILRALVGDWLRERTKLGIN